MSERNVDKKVTVAKSIKSSKSLKIRITDFVDTRTLANCKKISCTGYDQLCIPPGSPICSGYGRQGHRRDVCCS